MLSPRCGTSLVLLVAASLAGCSSTGRAPFGGGPNSRSVAVIGDHPTSAATGEPGARVAAEVDELDLTPRPSARARISGRVLDAQGRPVPDATVRLADGVAKGGRDIRTSTDRSGAFTLGGLRPDTNYTLIAETDDDQGPSRGSAEARASETGVEISLAVQGDGAVPRPSRPARTRPISERTERADDELVAPASDEVLQPSAANREDLGPPAEEVSVEGLPSADRMRPARARLSPPIAGTGWHRPGSSSDADPVAPPAESPAPVENSMDADEPEDGDFEPIDEGPNPLPPALEPSGDEPEQTSSRSRRRTRVGLRPDDADRGREGAGGMTLAARPSPKAATNVEGLPSAPELDPGAPSAALASALPEMPPALPGHSGPAPEPGGEGLPEMPSLASGSAPPGDAAAPPAADPPNGAAPLTADANSLPAAEPVFASEGENKPPAAKEADYNPFANPFVTQETNDPAPRVSSSFAPSRAAGPTIAIDVKPTSAPSAATPPVEPSPGPTPDPSPASKMTWGDMAKVIPATTAAVSRDKAKGKAKAWAVSATKDDATALCNYDARLHKLVDFRLPDLEGNPVRLKDLDADYVLLDFWGTWCKPCIDAVPHLVELQKKFGPGRLKIVGIACEQDDPKTWRAKVEETSRKLGINYAVLLSGVDGPCPLQEALHIQAFPTMIVLDRSGTIVWRDQGATAANLARLDRVLAARTARVDTIRR